MAAPQAIALDLQRLFEAIDRMVERVNRYKVDPGFSRDIEDRSAGFPDFAVKDEDILEYMVVLIAYSNNAPAVNVTPLVDSGLFKKVFQGYDIKKAAQLSPENIRAAYWQQLKAIRFKYKVDAMIRCAKWLLSVGGQYGSFMGFLKSSGLPTPIQTDRDIVAFWQSFDRVRAHLAVTQLPYFGNFTSLCHLLMHLGFDCAKPDVKVERREKVEPVGLSKMQLEPSDSSPVWVLAHIGRCLPGYT